MNKIYGFAAFLMLSLSVNSQVIEEENFDGFNIGNIKGQNGWDLYGGDTNEAKVETISVNYSKSLQFNRTGFTESMWVFKPAGLQEGWLNRETNNNILAAEFDFFTGDNSIGTAESGVQLYSENYNYIAGVYFDYSTKTFVGSTYPIGEAEVTYYDLGGKVFGNNEWVNVTMYYDKATGKVIWQFNKSSGMYEVYSDQDLDPVEFNFFTFGAKVSAVDNYVSSAVSEPTMTTTDSTVNNLFKIKIYPNPTTDFVNINASEKMSKLQMFDASGRLVYSTSLNENDAQVDMSTFVKGVYIVIANLANGKMHTQKVIKN